MLLFFSISRGLQRYITLNRTELSGDQFDWWQKTIQDKYMTLFENRRLFLLTTTLLIPVCKYSIITCLQGIIFCSSNKTELSGHNVSSVFVLNEACSANHLEDITRLFEWNAFFPSLSKSFYFYWPFNFYHILVRLLKKYDCHILKFWIHTYKGFIVWPLTCVREVELRSLKQNEILWITGWCFRRLLI